MVWGMPHTMISISVATGLIGKVELPHFTRPPRS
jgi:hypothetical protein